ncbi:hypothetical protein PFISCL1PPCAC_8164, partial [Pristionchus fissidentatus]
DDAIVLRTKSVAPGEMANILVGGGQPGQGPKVLCTESDCVVEGVNTGSLIVRVPVWNNSDSDMCFKKHDVIGCWNKVDSGIEESEGVSVETHSERVNRVNKVSSQSDWEETKKDLEASRKDKLPARLEKLIRERSDVFATKDEDLGRMHDLEYNIQIDASGCGIGAVLSQAGLDGIEKPLGFFSRGLRESERSMCVVDTEALAQMTAEERGDEERKRQMLEDLEEKEKIDQWIVDQGKDQWVLEMLQKLNEVKMGKRDLGEDVVVSGTNKKTCLADWTVSDGILYLLGEDHEQKLYIPEGRRDRFIQEIHDSPLSGHLSIKKLVQKLSQEVFWGTMLKDVQRVVRGCERCLLANSQKRIIPELKPILAQRFEIDRKLTLPYHSRANGLTERFNRTITEIVRRIRMRDDQWEEALPFAVYAYNTSPHGATGEAPAYLLYGREQRLPNSQLPQGNPAYMVDVDIDNYKRRLNWMMEKTRTIVVSRLENERRKMKAIYDENSKNNRGKVPVVGDRVYVKMEPKQGDLKKMVWQFEGPYRVVGRSDTTVTVVKVGNGFEDDGSSDKKVVQWNRVRLVPKESSETEMGTVNTVGASQELTDDQVHCRVTIDTSSILHPDAEC